MMIRNQFTHQFFADALPVLKQIIEDSYKLPEDQIAKLFNVMQADRDILQSSQLSGLGLTPEIAEGASLQYDDLVQGYSKTYTPAKYRLAAKITEEMIEDGKEIDMARIAKEMGLSMQYTRQILMFSVLNNGFTTAGADGQFLFDSDHPLYAAGGTDSNVGTADLGITSLRDGLIAMRDTRNAQGLKRPKMARRLVVPVDSQFLAKELIESVQKPQTADNDVNTLPKLEVSICDFLNLGSGVWVLLADKGEHDINFIQRSPMRVSEDVDFDGDAFKIASRERFDVGYNDWRGTFGSPGA